jgi:hypothetical protein
MMAAVRGQNRILGIGICEFVGTRDEGPYIEKRTEIDRRPSGGYSAEVGFGQARDVQDMTAETVGYSRNKRKINSGLEESLHPVREAHPRPMFRI